MSIEQKANPKIYAKFKKQLTDISVNLKQSQTLEQIINDLYKSHLLARERVLNEAKGENKIDEKGESIKIDNRKPFTIGRSVVELINYK